MSTNCKVIVHFLVYGKLKQFRNRIPEAGSVKLTFSLTVTVYHTKPENKTKKSLPQLSYYCFD